MRRWSATAVATVVVRVGGTMVGLGACASTTDPQVYAELALREDARDAASAVEPLGGADERLGIDTAAVAQALGGPGRFHGGVYAVRIPSGGTAVFHPAGGGDAALTGDVVLEARAVRTTVRALAAQGITVTNVRADSLATMDAVPGLPGHAVLHVWAVSNAVLVARGLHAALDPAAAR